MLMISIETSYSVTIYLMGDSSVAPDMLGAPILSGGEIASHLS
jgi:hypothetical protein